TTTSARAPPGDPQPPAPPRRRRRALMFGGGLAVLLAVAVAVPVVVLGGGGGHDGEPSAAERTRVSTRLAASAAVERARNPQLAARLSLAAYAVAPTAPARDALVLSFARSTASSVEPGGTTYTDLALSPDGRALAGTDEAGRLHLWRLTDGQRSTVASQPSQSDQASGVVFAADGRTLVTGGTDNAGRLWDVTDPDRPRPLGALGSQAATVRQLALSSTAHLLATAGGDSSVGLWDITDPSRPQPRFLLTGRGPVTDVALRPDGAVLAVAGVGGSVQLWNVRDPADPSQLGSVAGHTGAVNTIAFSPDGTQLATGGDDQVVQLADVHDPAHPGVARRLTGHHNAVTTVAYTGADRLLSADTAGTVAYWDLDGTGAAGKASSPSFTRIGALDGPVRAIGTTSAGTVAATTGKGQTFVGTLDPARLRRLACATPSVAPERAEWNREAPTIPYTDVCAP
ncbi:WD40 repeat domain-containing protein, partial [Frankia sp. R82]|uniref:WD40 repeat domain-containing protein n=1 Tax=Frankia sp. R82 TaxID=2950553 RepID=UPI0035ABBE59|nr:hypothetical protein [Frankia sp. R82]